MFLCVLSGLCGDRRLIGPLHAHVGRDHVHAQAQRRFEKTFIPEARHRARLQGIAAFVERAGQDVFVIVKEAPEFECGRA